MKRQQSRIMVLLRVTLLRLWNPAHAVNSLFTCLRTHHHHDMHLSGLCEQIGLTRFPTADENLLQSKCLVACSTA